MLNNPFANYMKYMYNSYPDNFGNQLTKFHFDGDLCDGVEIYYNLINNVSMCIICNNRTNKRCFKCKITYYCSRICQKLDYKIHKKICSNS